MEEYIVSARKYRPLTFDSVVGQHALTTTLKNAIASGKLAHAYLFCDLAEWARPPAHASLPSLSTAFLPCPTVIRAASVRVARLSMNSAR